MMKSVIIKDKKGKIIIKVLRSSRIKGGYDVDYLSYLENQITIDVIDEKNKRTRVVHCEH